MTRSQKLTFERHQWKIVPEQEIPNVEDGTGIAKLFLEHGGMLLSGPAGVGKSFILDYVLQYLESASESRVLTMAIRHAAAVIVGGKTISHYIHKFKAKGGAPKRGTIVIIDEWSEVQLHTWSELIKWKIVGVRFILVGDADGQRKPILDQWQAAMDAKDIRESQFIWELCGGLRVKLNKYRRGIDKKLFDDYTNLYEIADRNDRVSDTMWWGLGEYGRLKKIDHCFVISHNKRIPANRTMVYHRAEAAPTPLLFLPPPPGNHERQTLEPQAMILWRGLDVVCYNKRYSKSSPVTGCVYIVTDLDDKTVTIQLHSDYIRKERPKPEKPKADDDEEDSGSELDVEAAATKTPDKKQGGTSYKLTRKRAAELLRLRYAMVYASIQGITLTDRHACLMDLNHPRLTMRDIITAMSRPTRGHYLHFVEPDQAEHFFRYSETITDEMLEQLVIRRNRGQ